MRRNQSISDRSGRKLISIIGPTSSGKTALSLRLAKSFNAEIVSADSRQLYQGLTIGTGKATRAELRSVRHHLIDWKNPGKTVSLAEYKKAADTALNDIWSRGKNAFLVGGTPLYVRSVLDNYQIPEAKPDLSFRARLEKLPLPILFKKLSRIDSKAAAHIGPHNARRIIRALEVCHITKRKFSEQQTKSNDKYRSLVLGLYVQRDDLYRLIDARVDSRLRRGMIAEVKSLLKNGVRKKWLQSLGLEYRAIITYLDEGENRSNKEKMAQALKFAIHDFARRQLVWYRKFPDVHWLEPHDEAKAKKLIQSFLED